MKKTKLKSIFALIICGLLYLTFAVGSGSDATTSNTSTSTDSQTKTSEVAKYKLNDDIFIKNSSGEYRIKFTNVYETSDRNQFSDIVANKVVIIEYEYENISLPDDLLVDDWSFKLYDKENNSLETYPVDTKYSGSVGTGRKATASVAYALNSDSNYIELDYYDNMFNSKADCRVILEW